MYVVSKKRYQFEWKHLFGVTCPSKTYTHVCIPSCAETQMMGWLSTYLEKVTTLVTEHPRIVPSCYTYIKKIPLRAIDKILTCVGFFLLRIITR